MSLVIQLLCLVWCWLSTVRAACPTATCVVDDPAIVGVVPKIKACGEGPYCKYIGITPEDCDYTTSPSPPVPAPTTYEGKVSACNSAISGNCQYEEPSDCSIGAPVSNYSKNVEQCDEISGCLYHVPVCKEVAPAVGTNVAKLAACELETGCKYIGNTTADSIDDVCNIRVPGVTQCNATGCEYKGPESNDLCIASGNTFYDAYVNCGEEDGCKYDGVIEEDATCNEAPSGSCGKPGPYEGCSYCSIGADYKGGYANYDDDVDACNSLGGGSDCKYFAPTNCGVGAVSKGDCLGTPGCYYDDDGGDAYIPSKCGVGTYDPDLCKPYSGGAVATRTCSNSGDAMPTSCYCNGTLRSNGYCSSSDEYVPDCTPGSGTLTSTCYCRGASKVCGYGGTCVGTTCLGGVVPAPGVCPNGKIDPSSCYCEGVFRSNGYCDNGLFVPECGGSWKGMCYCRGAGVICGSDADCSGNTCVGDAVVPDGCAIAGEGITKSCICDGSLRSDGYCSGSDEYVPECGSGAGLLPGTCYCRSEGKLCGHGGTCGTSSCLGGPVAVPELCGSGGINESCYCEKSLRSNGYCTGNNIHVPECGGGGPWTGICYCRSATTGAGVVCGSNAVCSSGVCTGGAVTPSACGYTDTATGIDTDCICDGSLRSDGYCSSGNKYIPDCSGSWTGICFCRTSGVVCQSNTACGGNSCGVSVTAQACNVGSTGVAIGTSCYCEGALRADGFCTAADIYVPECGGTWAGICYCRNGATGDTCPTNAECIANACPGSPATVQACSSSGVTITTSTNCVCNGSLRTDGHCTAAGEYVPDCTIGPSQLAATCYCRATTAGICGYGGTCTAAACLGGPVNNVPGNCITAPTPAAISPSGCYCEGAFHTDGYCTGADIYVPECGGTWAGICYCRGAATGDTCPTNAGCIANACSGGPATVQACSSAGVAITASTSCICNGSLRTDGHCTTAGAYIPDCAASPGPVTATCYCRATTPGICEYGGTCGADSCLGGEVSPPGPCPNGGIGPSPCYCEGELRSVGYCIGNLYVPECGGSWEGNCYCRNGATGVVCGLNTDCDTDTHSCGGGGAASPIACGETSSGITTNCFCEGSLRSDGYCSVVNQYVPECGGLWTGMCYCRGAGVVCGSNEACSGNNCDGGAVVPQPCGDGNTPVPITTSCICEGALRADGYCDVGDLYVPECAEAPKPLTGTCYCRDATTPTLCGSGTCGETCTGYDPTLCVSKTYDNDLCVVEYDKSLCKPVDYEPDKCVEDKDYHSDLCKPGVYVADKCVPVSYVPSNCISVCTISPPDNTADALGKCNDITPVNAKLEPTGVKCQYQGEPGVNGVCYPIAPDVGAGTDCCATVDEPGCVQYCKSNTIESSEETMQSDCQKEFLPLDDKAGAKKTYANLSGLCKSTAECISLFGFWNTFPDSLKASVEDNSTHLFNFLFVDHKLVVPSYCTGDNFDACQGLWKVGPLNLEEKSFEDKSLPATCMNNLGQCLGFCSSNEGFCAPAYAELAGRLPHPILVECVLFGRSCTGNYTSIPAESFPGVNDCKNLKACRDIVIQNFLCSDPNYSIGSGASTYTYSADAKKYHASNKKYVNGTFCKELEEAIDDCAKNPSANNTCKAFASKFSPRSFLMLAFYWLAYLILIHHEHHHH